MTGVRSQFGALIGWLTLVVIGQQMAGVWLVERYAVTSGSMAPTLLGVHCHLKCHACNREYDIGLDSPPGIGQRAICPECGAQGPAIEDQPPLDGDRVYLDRSAYAWRLPKRWEVVAFRSPQFSSQVHVKRVVGLPGETVELRNGDVYINGIIPERTLDQIKAMSILVHDSGNESQEDPGHGPRWRPARDDSAWQRMPHNRWKREATTSTRGDALIFENRRRVSEDVEHSAPAPITDIYSYNQTRSWRDNHPVRDLWVALHARPEGAVQVTPATQWREWRQVAREETPVPNAIGEYFPGWFLSVVTWMEARDDEVPERHVADVDHLLRWFSADTEYARGVWSDDGPTQAVGFSIEANTGGELEQLRVYRDIYYTAPVGLTGALGIDRPYTLGPDEFFVLGDNSQLAVDSRYPTFGPIHAKSLVGKPIGVE